MNDVSIERDRQGGGYCLKTSIFLPQKPEALFDFFSDAFQLEKITPPELGFAVSTPAPIQIREGAEIDYRLRLLGFPARWRSRISVWDPPRRFVDEQLRGPYRRWHHEHLFEPANEGTWVHDIVHYKVPGGALVHSLLVKRDLERIFNFRAERLREIFGAKQA
jgi:ligand-binding SRPBCC domain-containing protein